jgi:hypothetical protein
MSCKNIIVIGNGGNILKKQNGHKIDNFDYVVRMGNCATKGYEEHTGTKTDLYRVSWDRLLYNINQDICQHTPYKYIDIHFNFKELLFLERDPDTFYETFPNNTRRSKILNKAFFTNNSFPDTIFKPYMHRLMHDSCIDFFKQKYSFKKHSYIHIVDRINAFMAVNKPTTTRDVILPSSGLVTLLYIMRLYHRDNIYITGFDGFKTRYYWRDFETYFDGHCGYREQLFLRKLKKEGRINEL